MLAVRSQVNQLTPANVLRWNIPRWMEKHDSMSCSWSESGGKELQDSSRNINSLSRYLQVPESA